MLNIDDEFGLDDLIEADIQYGLFEDDNKKVYQQESTNQNQKNTSNLYRNHNCETNPKVNKIIKVIFMLVECRQKILLHYMKSFIIMKE